MNYASIFAGIEGFGLAFERAGMTITAQVEKNPKRLKVLARHWPNTPRGEDVTEVSGRDLGRPDLVCGGFPCQGVSIGAPHRSGLRDERSGLYFEFVRLLDEHLRLVDATRPRWVIIENTPGLLTSGPPGQRGADMAAVVRGLENLGYGWAYRVVDSNGVGSTQRRQRVLVVGHRSGDPRVAWRVLADAERGGWSAGQPDSAPQGSRQGRPPLTGLAAPDDGPLIWRKSRNPRSTTDYATWVPSSYANTLAPYDGGMAESVRQKHLIAQEGRLRVLTPVEWERLQGFPDGWTADLKNGDRFHALGDAMNVDMAEWLGHRLMTVDAAIPLIGSSVRESTAPPQ